MPLNTMTLSACHTHPVFCAADLFSKSVLMLRESVKLIKHTNVSNRHDNAEAASQGHTIQ